MTLIEWLYFILAIQGIHFLGTWKLYREAGRKSWEAFVPVYNAIVLTKIINRPAWWVILLFIPVINLLMFPILWVETARSFGRNSLTDTWLSILTFGFYLYYINYFQEVKYVENRSLTPRTAVGEWVSSIVFAIIAATLVHTYIMQPYTIPTSSLEKSLLVGDFLFVSKFHYGAKVPSTVVAAPMVHDTLPFLKTKSYLFNDDPAKQHTSLLNKLQLPYLRLPGLQKIKRNDIVVFNWPADTVQQFFQKSKRPYKKPIDKKSNYVKRCVAIAGDSLEIRDGFVFINGERSDMPERAKPQFFYTVDTDGQNFSENTIYNKYQVRRGEALVSNGKYVLNLDEENAALLKKNPLVKSIVRNIRQKGKSENVYPSKSFGWNRDNFGPIYLPKAGETTILNSENLSLYKKIITEYEHNTLEVKGNLIYINKQLTQEYTFQQDYYWMMGDNRQNSEDSRFWGYVPFDHVVGKPVFVWFSIDTHAEGFLNKIRWERLFTTVHGEGKNTSYFYHFLVLLFLYFVYSKYQKRKKSTP